MHEDEDTINLSLLISKANRLRTTNCFELIAYIIFKRW
jgi:hypothetical protein